MNRDSHRLRITLVVLVLASFTFITLDSRSGKGGGALSGVRHATTSVFGPIQRGLGAVVHPIGTLFGDLAHAGRDGGRVRSLHRQVDALQAQLRQQGDIVRTKAELDALVALAAPNQYTLVPARVSALGDLSGFDQAAVLDVGSRDGIRPNMTVISGKGLVGRVVTVTPFTCTISLADDANVLVGSRLQRDASSGITSGHGLGSMSFTPTDASARPRKGDVVETYGSQTYAPGVPIGEVISVAPTPGKTTTTAALRPFVNYAALDVVGVVIATPRTTAATPTTPPRPTVTVTVTATPPVPATTRAPAPVPTPQRTAGG